MIYYELLMMVFLCIIQDICNAPLSPQSNICNVQSLWAYWQDDEASLRLPTPRPKEKGVLEDGGSIGGSYLDHFLICSRYNARIKKLFSQKRDKILIVSTLMVFRNQELRGNAGKFYLAFHCPLLTQFLSKAFSRLYPLTSRQRKLLFSVLQSTL